MIKCNAQQDKHKEDLQGRLESVHVAALEYEGKCSVSETFFSHGNIKFERTFSVCNSISERRKLPNFD